MSTNTEEIKLGDSVYYRGDVWTVQRAPVEIFERGFVHIDRFTDEGLPEFATVPESLVQRVDRSL